ncbi:MAG: PepSY-like domain-containing protein [bacterium]
MATRFRFATLVTLLLCVVLAGSSFSQEQSIKKKDVPKAILDAFQKAYPKATIKGYSKETEKDATVYEIESTEGKIKRDITYSSDGSMISAEETLPYASLPDAVRKTIAKEFPKAKISTTEKVTKDATVQYELVVTVKKEQYEVVLNPDGSIVSKKKKEGKEEKEEKEEKESKEKKEKKK